MRGVLACTVRRPLDAVLALGLGSQLLEHVGRERHAIAPARQRLGLSLPAGLS